MVGRTLDDWKAERALKRLRAEVVQDSTREGRQAAQAQIEALVAHRAREVGVAAIGYTADEIERARKELWLGLGRTASPSLPLDQSEGPIDGAIPTSGAHSKRTHRAPPTKSAQDDDEEFI